MDVKALEFDFSTLRVKTDIDTPVREDTIHVKDNEAALYTEWWAGKNVHFGGKQADALGRLLAGHVKKVMADRK